MAGKKGKDKTKGQGKKKESTAITTTLANDKALGKIFVDSGFFSDAKQESQAIVKILAGREAGLQPIESMTGIHIIKGKISFGSNMMAAAVKKHPNYDYRVKEHNETKCVIDFFEITYDLRDREPTKELAGTSSFSLTDAKNAGVMVSGGSWYKYPKAMLFARAMSAGVRYYCPDVFGHTPVYVPEEMGEAVDEDGEPVNITPTRIPISDEEKAELEDLNDVEDAEFEDVAEQTPEPEGALTYSQLGDIYDEHHTGRKARTLPMEKVTEWASKHPELFRVDGDGYYYLIEDEAEVQDAELKGVDEDDSDDRVRDIPDDLINETMTSREALKEITNYAFNQEIGDVVRPAFEKHYPEWKTGQPFIYNIPEKIAIKIVEELSGVKLKRAEKDKKCSACECKITEPEAEEQTNDDDESLCLRCFTKFQESEE